MFSSRELFRFYLIVMKHLCHFDRHLNKNLSVTVIVLIQHGTNWFPRSWKNSASHGKRISKCGFVAYDFVNGYSGFHLVLLSKKLLPKIFINCFLTLEIFVSRKCEECRWREKNTIEKISL